MRGDMRDEGPEEASADGVAGAGSETRAETPEQTWEEVAPAVWRCRLPGWDETVGAVAGAREALLVDAGPSRRAGAAVAARLRDLLGPPVRRVVLTHPHFDHVLGVAAFPGAEVYGSAGLGRYLADAPVVDEALAHGLDPRDAKPDALAGLRVTDVTGETALDLGGGRRAVLVPLGAAHSPHDLAVLVPGTPPVVFCGDLVEESGEPQAGPDARPEAWPAALDRLLALGGPAARYVPGHGAVVDAAFVRAQRRELAERFGVG
ncbi:MBL fold metallo-hydrolase [Streptomyces sp. B6B3]|uniref:MBL fold metallo-hydrolase n=1 Tax=Streptomyces sp. B6B3 TaxID=3153570 RepID=UPI00325CFCC2